MKKTLLETILDSDELSVRFQPIFHIGDGIQRIHSLEALIRGPRGTKFEGADLLFDYVRRKRAETAVDHSCFTAICSAVTALPDDIRININVHAATLGHKPAFVDFFKDLADQHSLALDRFTIEIVEHAPSCHIPGLARSISALRSLGVSIALDDVGLGQSNYRMIIDCLPEYFKLDAYFVQGVSIDPRRRAVVESVLTLADSMGSLVVAEGADSRDDLAKLSQMGVALVQGNLLCPASPLEDLVATGLLGIHLPKPKLLARLPEIETLKELKRGHRKAVLAT
jgi:EAL domain-containing protein (putative c-di-GMP-specific phosphodiesterase class I)